MPKFNKAGRTAILTSIGRDIQRRIESHIRDRKYPPKMLTADDIAMDPGRMARAVAKYEKLCAHYKHRLDYDDTEERVNAGKIAALQAIALLWEAPWIAVRPERPAARQVAGNANFLFAAYVVQEFLELSHAKFKAVAHERLHGVLGQIVADSARNQAPAPPAAVVDALIMTCEMLRKVCR